MNAQAWVVGLIVAGAGLYVAWYALGLWGRSRARASAGAVARLAARAPGCQQCADCGGCGQPPATAGRATPGDAPPAQPLYRLPPGR